MKGRSRKILSRFPQHFEATRPGKQLSVVTDALATNLDEQSAIMARIRRSHRLGDADELRDLLLIAAFHGITQAELALLFTRFELAGFQLSKLATAATPADRDKAAEALCDLWSISLPQPRLPLFAIPPAGGGAPDLMVAKLNLTKHASVATSRDALLDAVRIRIAKISMIHASGNGTVNALLEGAANSLDLDIIEWVHSPDRFWHAAVVRDRLTLTCPALEPSSGAIPAREVAKRLEISDELMGVEENPIERTSTDPVVRHHTEPFSVLRRGFERATLQVRITGRTTTTVGPMVVNRTEGHGLGYTGSVPAGSELVFTEEGRVRLDGSDVTSFSFAWKGACFAGADSHSEDFVFDGPGVPPTRQSRFAEASPAGALDSDFVFPHGGESLPMPGINVGETRFAFFVQQAYFSLLETSGGDHVVMVAPRSGVGFLDASVFAAGPEETKPEAAIVALSWLEHRPFCVRVLIPRRFSAWASEQDPEGIQILQRVAQASKRFQPAGVEVRVEFRDDRWVLGAGTLGIKGSDDPIMQLHSGMLLWSAPA
ncbi:MAG TPA: hypothetical protein VEW46_01420 [Pyrinomonadaceae bacterium]|nr:hypothetical protein [Pyrinomonadaceae bacterium]